MTDRPIIFSAPMVRALLAERKTQTRRIYKVPSGSYVEQGGVWAMTDGCAYGDAALPYTPGDRLWVRENCATWGDHEAIYRADDAVEYGLAVSDGKFGAKWKARPSIHMPRWASRLTLTVSDVRVQLLQDISEADAIAEGIDRLPDSGVPNHFSVSVDGGWLSDPTAIGAYGLLWEHIHGPGAWDANPWVAALTFTVQRGNIDQIGDANG